MVKVQVGDEIWRVAFTHHYHKNPKRRYTSCVVTREGQPNRALGIPPSEVVHAVSKCRPGDTWNRGLGTKVALQHALGVNRQDKAEQAKLTSWMELVGLNEEVRTAIWRAYWEARKPQPQNPPRQPEPEPIVVAEV